MSGFVLLSIVGFIYLRNTELGKRGVLTGEARLNSKSPPILVLKAGYLREIPQQNGGGGRVVWLGHSSTSHPPFFTSSPGTYRWPPGLDIPEGVGV